MPRPSRLGPYESPRDVGSRLFSGRALDVRTMLRRSSHLAISIWGGPENNSTTPPTRGTCQTKPSTLNPQPRYMAGEHPGRHGCVRSRCALPLELGLAQRCRFVVAVEDHCVRRLAAVAADRWIEARREPLACELWALAAKVKRVPGEAGFVRCNGGATQSAHMSCVSAPQQISRCVDSRQSRQTNQHGGDASWRAS